jgi:Tol biopolymer transport system component
VATRLGRRERVAWLATGFLVLTLGALLLGGFVRKATGVDAHVYRASIQPTDGAQLSSSVAGSIRFALSPDGTRLAVVEVGRDARTMIWIQVLDTGEAHPLAGTEGGSSVFWSPDNRSVGFVAQGKLKTVSVAGGPVAVLADAPIGGGAGTWSRDGIIVFPSSGGRELLRVAATGGTTASVVPQGAGRYAFPWFLPDRLPTSFVAATVGVDAGGAGVDARCPRLFERPARS